ncbi:hypothetical protein F441_18505 [Phytophthora nicotianae CJ01A1]|uniref:Uncharacterized protein n=6 Tax=Phytophthora nicotianae TaxID=4792 RepID=W2PMP3_PHYN3|nr:hypothetical protein PPTG_24095 [Phytophthora nicotianae INRA-310]ETI34965.1 hypothetical protein F443_18645 [Phytophthora nicotianae P1569]ETK75251.1 hypothetical protein L915_18126 [Phytophthora nicotianae]ETO63718.1 hypothetical protein F444_18640 [Phytophthora nicotianae P1976]ETP04786.1 hypothetical protein F441_18505 [Phytophthora nicotianae CJ01A1]ETP32965.1 hypothetical protein F442_18446 [Phytophthora nicotianae P10297]
MDLSTFGLEQCTASSSGNDWLISPSLFARCWKHIGYLDYYSCVYEDPDEDDTISAVLATMLSRLHAKDPMSVDKLLNPPDENTTTEDSTDKHFCRVGDQ